MSTQQYEYMVTYKFQGGYGRCFITTETPIDSRQRVEEIEREIRQENSQLSNLLVSSFQLLREYQP